MIFLILLTGYVKKSFPRLKFEEAFAEKEVLLLLLHYMLKVPPPPLQMPHTPTHPLTPPLEIPSNQVILQASTADTHSTRFFLHSQFTHTHEMQWRSHMRGGWCLVSAHVCAPQKSKTAKYLCKRYAPKNCNIESIRTFENVK